MQIEAYNHVVNSMLKFACRFNSLQRNKVFFLTLV